MNYKALDQRQPEISTFGSVPGSAGNFYTGDFDLFLTSRISDHVSVLGEIVFGQGDDQTFNVDLERLLFKYDLNDSLKMSLGRYHTGVSYYNTAFHSGKWLQTTADRPLVVEFAADGGILPTHAIGVSTTGLLPSGKLGLHYVFEYGTSDTMRPRLDGRGSLNENNGNSVNVGWFIRPEGWPGFQSGGSVYHDRANDSDRGANLHFGQTIVNTHVVYVRRGIEFLNEGFLIRHAYDLHGPAYNMPAFYSQFSKKFGHIRPFTRYQYINANPKSILGDVSLRHGPSFGARYDFNEYVAFKAQLDHAIRKGKADLNGVQMQLAFTF